MKRFSYKWNLKKKVPLLAEDPNGSFILLEDAEVEIDYWKHKYEELLYIEKKSWL
jgi:hypothetical protein